MADDNVLALLMEVLSIFVITKDVISMSCMPTSKYTVPIILLSVLHEREQPFMLILETSAYNICGPLLSVAKRGYNHISTSFKLYAFL